MTINHIKMKASYTFTTILFIGFVTNGLTENLFSISSEIIDSTTLKLSDDMKRDCDQNSSPVAFKIFQKAEGLLKSRVQLKLQATFRKIMRSTYVLKKNSNDLCDIDDAVNTYIAAAKPCLMGKEIQFHIGDSSNTILERGVPTLEINGVVNPICGSMKSALRDLVDSRCFKQSRSELRECFMNNEFFKNHVSILTDPKTMIEPRKFPFEVIKTAQPSFINHIREIVGFRRCVIDVLKSCEFSSLGSYMELMFLPSIESIQSLIDQKPIHDQSIS